MADKKFSQFTLFPTLSGSEKIVGHAAGANIQADINTLLNYIGANISQFILLYDTNANWTAANLTLPEGFITIESDTLTTFPKFKIPDGVTAWNDLPYFSTKIGLIQIEDKYGDFFTDLASATAYIEQFITPSVITDKSFNEGIFFFTVPYNTPINGYFLIDNGTPAVTYASLIDRFGLLDLTNAQEFGYMNAGHHILGNGLFQNSAFNLFSGTIEMNSLYISTSGGNFAESSTGKFIIKENIGINETAQFGVNFFLNSTATIFANASKYTSNVGGIHGDLQQAIINGCNVFFDGIDKENKINKGVANGYAPLNSSAKIDATYLPSYVDDVVEGYLLSNVFYEESSHITVIPAGTGKIYIDLTIGQKNKEYRYSGSTYIQITNGLIASTDDVTEGSSNLYFTTARVLATVLTGLNTSLTGVITSSDTILTTFGRIQNQISNLLTTSSIATINHGATSKSILVDADELSGQDSAASFSLIRTTCLNLYTYLKGKFDLVYHPKIYSYIDTSLGTLSSGASNTLSKSVLIPANTLTSGLLNIHGRSVKTGTGSFGWLNIYVNTSNSMSGAVLIGQMNNASNNTILNFAMQRNIPIQSGSFTAFIVNTIVGSETVITNNISTVTIDWTVDQYIILAVQANSGAESLRANFLSVNQF